MKKSLIIAALATAVGLQAEIIGEISTLKDVNPASRLELTGAKQFKAKNYAWFTSSKRYPIDPKKSYRITGEYRVAPGAKVDKKFSIGFYPLDAKDRTIHVVAVNAKKGTETELAAPVKAGDKAVKIKDCSKWVDKNGYIAFNVDPSGKMSDLPCMNTSNAITKITKNGDVWEVEVRKPVDKAYDAGTAVREHLGGWSFLCSDYVLPAAEWQKATWTVKPGAAKTNTRTQWLYGAEKFIAVLVVPAGVEFRNVTIEALD